MKKPILLIALAAAMLLQSCSSFLEEYSQHYSYINTVDDLNEMLAGSAYMVYNSVKEYGKVGYFSWQRVVDDDTEQWIANDNTNQYAGYFLTGFYTWQAYPYYEDKAEIVTKNQGGNVFWEYTYDRIGGINIILDEVRRFEEDEPEMCRKIKGESLFLRAMYHFYLVNSFGVPYDASTARSDLGIPIKIDTYIEAEGYERNSIQECYDQIIADLDQALIYLKDIVQPNKMRASENAVRVLLSRVYLYMGDWEKAYEYADQVIQTPLGCELMDMNDYTATSYKNAALSKNNYYFEENIHVNCGGTNFQLGNGIVFKTADALLNMYEDNDLRRSYLFADKKSGIYQHVQGVEASNASTSCFSYFSISIVEAYLNKAEAAAMMDDDATARATVRNFLDTRIKKNTTAYTQLETLSGEDLVRFIRDERRRDYPHRGYRWFDLRRYAVSPKYPQKTSITHSVPVLLQTHIAIAETYTLGTYPEDDGWVLPFPTYAINSNMGKLVDNPRKERLPD